jgi:NAD(P)-dependent dehydrogenase (short-subunit alcohol dehydrogenase family)
MMIKKTLLLTGASHGLGKATVQLFAERGWNVAAAMLDTSWAPELDAFDNVIKLRLDLTDKASIHTAVDQAIERFGTLDVLINNAGYGAFGPLEAADEGAIEKLYATNVLGPIFVTKAVVQHMRARRAGLIMFVTSITGHCSSPFNSIYHGCKWAVEGFAESLLYELMDFNVRLKMLVPGAMATSFYQNTYEHLAGAAEDYKPGLERFQSGLADALAGMPGPETVAPEIYAAATDGSPQFRHFITDMSRFIIGDRRAKGDEAWIAYSVDTYLKGKSIGKG